MKWIVFLLFVTSGMAKAGDELVFLLCASYVQESVAGEQADDGDWPVFVRLTESGAVSFEKFTEANVGRMSRIVVNSREFARAMISAPIRSGNLRGDFGSREDARGWQLTLTEGLPAVPCGAD